jgi:hypothetical protein
MQRKIYETLYLPQIHPRGILPLHRTLASDDHDKTLEIVGSYMPDSSNYTIETYAPDSKKSGRGKCLSDMLSMKRIWRSKAASAWWTSRTIRCISFRIRCLLIKWLELRRTPAAFVFQRETSAYHSVGLQILRTRLGILSAEEYSSTNSRVTKNITRSSSLNSSPIPSRDSKSPRLLSIPKADRTPRRASSLCRRIPVTPCRPMTMARAWSARLNWRGDSLRIRFPLAR